MFVAVICFYGYAVTCDPAGASAPVLGGHTHLWNSYLTCSSSPLHSSLEVLSSDVTPTMTLLNIGQEGSQM